MKQESSQSKEQAVNPSDRGNEQHFKRNNTSQQASVSEVRQLANNINVGEVGGDFKGNTIVGGDNVTKERDLTTSEEVRQALEKAVNGYVSRIHELANNDVDALKGGPYRGLRTYTLREAEIFFGRHEALSSLERQLAQDELTILHAESGAGKSSLLQAGLQKRLINKAYIPVYVRPYDKSPAQAIKQVLCPNLNQIPGLSETSLTEFLHQVSLVFDSEKTL
ncbi:MAG: hypothetical protein AAF629_31050, partial [Chloroflexota bacterium]